jgi:CheY-like chemotaxis protein
MSAATPVMIVDDDDDVRAMLEIVLVDQGFDVTSASNGKQALEQLRNTPVAPVVLLDLRMPVMTGWEMIEALRDENRLDAVPIIICTSSPNEAPSGFAVVAKPVSLQRLVGAIREVRPP